jgi:hypothetical protein
MDLFFNYENFGGFATDLLNCNGYFQLKVFL